VDVAWGAQLGEVAVGRAAAEAELVGGVGADVVGGRVDGVEAAVGWDAGRSARGGGNAPKAGGTLNGPPRGWSRVTRCSRPQR
jgi:hypothetical protein